MRFVLACMICTGIVCVGIVGVIGLAMGEVETARVIATGLGILVLAGLVHQIVAAEIHARRLRRMVDRYRDSL